jgi:hypothetical protein
MLEYWEIRDFPVSFFPHERTSGRWVQEKQIIPSHQLYAKNRKEWRDWLERKNARNKQCSHSR